MRRLLAVPVVLGLGLAACAPPPQDFDPGAASALGASEDHTGTPANATVTPAVGFCQGVGHANGSVFVSDPSSDGEGIACKGEPIGSEQGGYQITVNARMTVSNLSGSGDVAQLTVVALNAVSGKTETYKQTLHASSVPGPGANVNLFVPFFHRAVVPFTVELTSLGNGALSIEQLELIPDERHLVIGPGSKVPAADDVLTIESALGDDSLAVTLNGNDVTAQLSSLIANSGDGSDENGNFRRVRQLALADIVDVSQGPVVLNASAANELAQVTLRPADPSCAWEGDPNATVRVLISGFEPFPIGTTSINVSEVAVQALDPTQLPGVQVMRVILPVEFDSAGNELASIIARCSPSAVIAFGCESGENNLEVQGHNTQSSSGWDNRGILRTDHLIAPGGADTLPVTLPASAIIAALAPLGGIQHSDTLGGDEYICNDVTYHLLDAVAGSNVPAGFVHLASQTTYSDQLASQLATYIQAIIQATAASISGSGSGN
jgi:pyrrolidone-carboxylate peptidase